MTELSNTCVSFATLIVVSFLVVDFLNTFVSSLSPFFVPAVVVGFFSRGLKDSSLSLTKKSNSSSKLRIIPDCVVDSKSLLDPLESDIESTLTDSSLMTFIRAPIAEGLDVTFPFVL